MSAPADGAVALVIEREDTAMETRRHLPVIAEPRRGDRTRPGARPKTLSMRRQSKRELARVAAEYPDTGERGPASRAECPVERPCGYVSCAAHLALDINPSNGNIKVNFPNEDGEPDLYAMPETCVLDVAERGGITLEETGAALGITRERVRQVEDVILAKLRAHTELREHLDERATPLPPRERPEPVAAEPVRVDWFAEDAANLDGVPEVEAAWAAFVAEAPPVEPVRDEPVVVAAPPVLATEERAELLLARERADAAEALASRLTRQRDHYRDEADAEIARLTSERDAMRAQRDAAEAEVARMLRGVSDAHAIKARLDRMRAQRDEARAMVAAAMAQGLAECERLRAMPTAPPAVLLDEGMLTRVVADATRSVLRAIGGAS